MLFKHGEQSLGILDAILYIWRSEKIAVEVCVKAVRNSEQLRKRLRVRRF